MAVNIPYGWNVPVGRFQGVSYAQLTAGTQARGDIARIIDAADPGLHIGDLITAGGGSTSYLASYNGTNWQVISGPKSSGGPITAPGGRLSLVGGNPVLTSIVTGANTIFYSNYIGTFVPIWDNAQGFIMRDTLGTLSQTLADTTKSPAAAVANSNYDIFAWDDNGTIRISRGPPWTSDTSRGTGAGTSQLTGQFGILLNFVAITNGPGAALGTYLGTIRTNASALCDWKYPGIASGGVQGIFGVYNYYNRVLVGGRNTDNSATYTYTSATIRQANGSTENKISFINGFGDEPIDITYNPQLETTNVSLAFQEVGIGLDTTTSFTSSTIFNITTSANNSTEYGAIRHLLGGEAFGWHFVSANEKSDGSNANGFNHSSASTLTFLARM